MANKWFILYCDGNEWNADPLEIGDIAEWTIHPEARIGDFGLIYAKSPVKAFVSIVKVLENATRSDEPIYHARNEGWAEVEVIDEIFDPPEYSEFGSKQELRNAWPLVKSQMQPSKGPEKIPRTAVEILAEYIVELEDLLTNPENEHRSGRRKVYRILAPNGQPLKNDVFFETREEADKYINQPAAKGYGLWIREDIE